MDIDIMHNRYATKYEHSQYRVIDGDGIQRYLFLDIDGVLNTMRYSNYLIDHDEDDTDEDGALFDPEAVENLSEIIKNYQEHVVLTDPMQGITKEIVIKVMEKLCNIEGGTV